MNQFPPQSRVSHEDRFEFFRKLSEIFASPGAPPVSTTPVANLPPVSVVKSFMIEYFFPLPPVSATSVVHLKLWISPRIFVYSGAWGKLIYEKNSSRKSRYTVPLKRDEVKTLLQGPNNDLRTVELSAGWPPPPALSKILYDTIATITCTKYLHIW